MLALHIAYTSSVVVAIVEGIEAISEDGRIELLRQEDEDGSANKHSLASIYLTAILDCIVDCLKSL